MKPLIPGRSAEEHNRQYSLDFVHADALLGYVLTNFVSSAFGRRPNWLFSALCRPTATTTGSCTARCTTPSADLSGIVPWINGMYHAALRAGEVMATEVGEHDFSGLCAAIRHP
jgi:hypothetical protein